jgi:hypothetical protein
MSLLFGLRASNVSIHSVQWQRSVSQWLLLGLCRLCDCCWDCAGCVTDFGTVQVGTVQVVTHRVRDEHIRHDLRKRFKTFNSKFAYFSFRSNRGYCAENGKSNAKHNAPSSPFTLIQAVRVTLMTLLGMIWRKNTSQSSFLSHLHSRNQHVAI